MYFFYTVGTVRAIADTGHLHYSGGRIPRLRSVLAIDSTGTITYRCNAQASNITVALTRGGSSTFSPRRMFKGVEVLTYNLFRNAARTNVWGDGTSGTAVYSRANPPNNSNVNLTVYGRVPAGQDVSAGTFSDTVTAVINF